MFTTTSRPQWRCYFHCTGISVALWMKLWRSSRDRPTQIVVTFLSEGRTHNSARICRDGSFVTIVAARLPSQSRMNSRGSRRSFVWTNRIFRVEERKKRTKDKERKKDRKKKAALQEHFLAVPEEPLKRRQSHPYFCPLSHGNTGIPLAKRSIAFFSGFKASSSCAFTLRYLQIVSQSFCWP